MLEGREDITVLWDIRVAPKFRRQGVGSRLFEAAVGFSEKRRCEFMKIETQSINVPACRFYEKHGCVLGAVNRFAYRDFPDEIEMLWYKML